MFIVLNMIFRQRVTLLEIRLMVNLLWQRIVIAITTVPYPQDLGLTAVVLIIYSVLALPIGFFSGFLQWKWHKENYWRMVLQTLITPALLEELIFRGLLLPHPREGNTTESLWWWSGLSLLLLVFYHPLNGLTLYKPGFIVFRQPVFLSLATLLGISCTVLYQLTGSLWTAVVMHWFVVIVWLGWLGGTEQLIPPEQG